MASRLGSGVQDLIANLARKDSKLFIGKEREHVRRFDRVKNSIRHSLSLPYLLK